MPRRRRRRPQLRFDQGDRPRQRAAFAGDALAPGLAAPAGLGGIGQQVPSIAAARAAASAMRATAHRVEQQRGDLGEIVHVRTDHRRHAQRRGFQQVVAADLLQAAADEGDIGAGVEATSARPAYRSRTPARRAGGCPSARRVLTREAGALAGARDRGEAFGMARRPQQQGRPGARASTSRCAAITASSSPSCVLAAIQTGRAPQASRQACAITGSSSGTAMSYLRLPVTSIRACVAHRAAR